MVLFSTIIAAMSSLIVRVRHDLAKMDVSKQQAMTLEGKRWLMAQKAVMNTQWASEAAEEG